MKQEKYYVFVDIDGVLVTTRANFELPEYDYKMQTMFDPIGVKFFNYIDRTYEGVYFVLTSTWKNNLCMDLNGPDNGDHFHWVVSAFRNAGFTGNFAANWKTGYRESMTFPKYKRGSEVKQYLEENPCKDYIIFDDEDNGYDVLDKKRLIWTLEHEGISCNNMKMPSR